jgi:hypothetical protein
VLRAAKAGLICYRFGVKRVTRWHGKNPVNAADAAKIIFTGLKAAGINLIATLPDINLAQLLHEVEADREALSHALTYYALADYYRDLLGAWDLPRSGGDRAAWKSGGFTQQEIRHRSAFRRIALVAATSAEDSGTDQTLPAGRSSRIILPYVAEFDDVVSEVKHFITC